MLALLKTGVSLLDTWRLWVRQLLLLRLLLEACNGSYTIWNAHITESNYGGNTTRTARLQSFRVIEDLITFV